MTEIKLAAVGDILMIGPILSLAKVHGQDKYNFDPLFGKVSSYLKQADFVIGNLETPLAGRENRYTRKNAKTGFSMFNCPDELAPALRNAGFHFLTTANNHCMDRGEAGLTRTLKILDQHGLKHTGTFDANPGDHNHWVGEIKGIRTGIVSYTKPPNKIPLPANKHWMVNLIDAAYPDKLLAHVRRLRSSVDLVVVCIHVGRECRPYPEPAVRRLVSLLLRNGAHIVLGCHPHVLQPMFVANHRFAIYSLGDFASTRLYHNANTNCGMIVQLTVRKAPGSEVKVSSVSCVPTWITQLRGAGSSPYRVVPIERTVQNPEPRQSAADRKLMRSIWKATSARIKAR